MVPVPEKLSPFQAHCNKWKAGCGSVQCEGARVVLCRGKLPCDILFVGEAPGESERVVGVPFVGPAGKLLDSIIARAVPPVVRYAMTNLVGCIPREEDGGKATEPDDEQVESCKPRLVEFISIASPRMIICVGKLARDWFDQGWKHSIKLPYPIPTVDITHPAAILRMPIAHQGLAIQRCVVVVKNAVEDMEEGAG
jgi:uracil-DNA glycosylase family 4